MASLCASIGAAGEAMVAANAPVADLKTYDHLAVQAKPYCTAKNPTAATVSALQAIENKAIKVATPYLVEGAK